MVQTCLRGQCSSIVSEYELSTVVCSIGLSTSYSGMGPLSLARSSAGIAEDVLNVAIRFSCRDPDAGRGRHSSPVESGIRRKPFSRLLDLILRPGRMGFPRHPDRTPITGQPYLRHRSLEPGHPHWREWLQFSFHPIGEPARQRYKLSAHLRLEQEQIRTRCPRSNLDQPLF